MFSILAMPRHAARSRSARTRQVAQTLARHGLASLAEELGLRRLAPRFGRIPREMAHAARAERLRFALGELGATFIKVGQMLSTRADLLPAEFIAELAKLQDSAPPVPFEEVERVVREDLAGLPQPIFASFNRAPIASASIGQVHGAVLRDGTPAVVKVRRPGVVEQVELDLGILRSIVEWVQIHTPIGREYDLRPLLDEFANTLRDELDYSREAQNAIRLRRAFEGDRGVRIPFIFEEYSTARVLTMEHVGGVKITDLESLDRMNVPRRGIAENAVRVFLREVFEFGFFHADPHPGNFFVQPDASLAIVDFGMVGRLSADTHRHLLRALLAASRLDAEDLGEEICALGVAGSRVNRPAFERDLAHLLGRYGGCSIGELSAATVTNELCRIVFRHKLQLPGELALLLRVVSMGEGIGLMLDPDFHYLEYAGPIIRKNWRRAHSPTSVATRAVRAAAEAIDLGAGLPRRVARLLGRVERGDIRLNVDHTGLEHVTREFQRMTNRLALAIILGASVIALGIAAGIRLVPALEPIIGWLFRLGLVFSLALGASVLWGMWRAERR